METMKVQAQIRRNAEEVSSYLSEMSKWESRIKHRVTKDRKTTTDPNYLPVREGSGTVKVVDKVVGTASLSNSTYRTKHDHELDERSQCNLPLDGSSGNDCPRYDSSANLTPASLVQQKLHILPPCATVPAARGQANPKDIETTERERGNIEFESGNFRAAVKSYTRCLGLKGKNYIALSNRAMAYIKLKEFFRAESDCSFALDIEPTHVKSLIRRATCRNHLGKHRAAMLDLTTAKELEPGNKQVRAEIVRTSDLLRAAVNRAPLVTVPTVWISDKDRNSTDFHSPDPLYIDGNLSERVS